MATDPRQFSPALPPTIWGNRPIVLLWLAQLVSLFGDHIFNVALLWLVLDLTDSNSAAGLVAMSVYLPMIVFGLLAGPLVDRWDRRRVMIVSDAARFGLLLLFPLLIHFGLLTLGAIFVLAFSIQTFTTLFLPARDVLIGEMAPRQHLPSANALIQSAAPIAMIAGPAVAGALMPLVGVAHLFTLDAVTFLFSLGFLLMIARPAPLIDRPFARGKLWSDLREGLAYARRSTLVSWLLLITAVDNWFIMGPAIIGLPIFVRTIIGGPRLLFGMVLEPAQIYAALIVSFACGYILSSMFIRHLHLRFNRGRVLLIGIFLDGITYAPLLWLTDPHLVALMLFLHGIAVPPIVVTRTSLVQETVPEQLRGRVFAMINLTVTGVTALSIGVSGFIIDAMGIALFFGLWGLIGALTGPAGWLVRDLREAGNLIHPRPGT